MIAKFFHFDERETNLKQETIGGITTFLTMAYIVIVNPMILSDGTGMDKGALITVTCLAAAIGSLLVAFIANMPLAMAPGMGMNAFFTYSLVLGRGIPWQQALGIVFLSGMLFLILTFMKIREKIVDAIPISIRYSIAAGIGLFIALIGLKNMGLIVANPATLIGLGKSWYSGSADSGRNRQSREEGGWSPLLPAHKCRTASFPEAACRSQSDSKARLALPSKGGGWSRHGSWTIPSAGRARSSSRPPGKAAVQPGRQ